MVMKTCVWKSELNDYLFISTESSVASTLQEISKSFPAVKRKLKVEKDVNSAPEKAFQPNESAGKQAIKRSIRLHYQRSHHGNIEVGGHSLNSITDDLLQNLVDGKLCINYYAVGSSPSQTFETVKEIVGHLKREFERQNLRSVDLPSLEKSIEDIAVIFANGFSIEMKHLSPTMFGASLKERFLKQATRNDKSHAENSKKIFDAEWTKQSKRKNDLLIVGVPQAKGENLREIFKRICSKLNVKSNFPYEIRRVWNGIRIELSKFARKQNILRKYKAKRLWLEDVVPNGPRKMPIIIKNDCTTYFNELEALAQNAVDKRIIQTFWPSKDGFMLKRTKNGQPTSVYSIQELGTFIDKSKKFF